MNIQSIAVLLIIAAAVIAAAVSIARGRRKGTGCGSCGGCGISCAECKREHIPCKK